MYFLLNYIPGLHKTKFLWKVRKSLGRLLPRLSQQTTTEDIYQPTSFISGTQRTGRIPRFGMNFIARFEDYASKGDLFLEFLLEDNADVMCHCKDQLLTTITYAIYVCTSSDNITATFLIQKMVFAYRLNNWKHGTRFRILSPDETKKRI